MGKGTVGKYPAKRNRGYKTDKQGGAVSMSEEKVNQGKQRNSQERER